MPENEISKNSSGDRPRETFVREIADFAIIHLDAQGSILSWNKGAELVFGFAPEEITGRHFSLIYTPENRDDGIPQENLDLAKKNGRAEDARRLQKKDGSLIYCRVVFNSLPDESGVSDEFALIARVENQPEESEQTNKNLYDLVEQGQLDGLNADIGNLLVQNTSISDLLQNCAESLVKHLDAAFARIWTLNREENILELQASAGIYTHLDGAHARVPVGKFKIGMIAEERLPRLTNDILKRSAAER